MYVSETGGIRYSEMDYTKVPNISLQSDGMHPLAEWPVECLGLYSYLKDELGI